MPNRNDDAILHSPNRRRAKSLDDQRELGSANTKAAPESDLSRSSGHGGFPCPEDPTKNCVECADFDECAYPDRRSSLKTIGLPISLGLLALAATAFFIMRG